MKQQAVFEKHPARKGMCPQCRHKGVFRYYAELPREYGKCERINSCGYHNKPNGQLSSSLLVSKKAVPSPKIVFPEESLCKSITENQTSVFHKICTDKLNIPAEHFQKWNIGSRGNETAFVYQDAKKQFLNIKFMEYDESCHRKKEKPPYSLSSKRKNEKYSLCLFGEHLLSDKINCLVESEKTAFIASYFYPQYDWLATGSRNGLTEEKISSLADREIYYLPDADKAGRENSTLKILAKHTVNYKTIDLFPNRDDGYDLADAIFDGLRPEINPTAPDSPMKPPKAKGAKGSLFERVEEVINDEYELRFNEVSNEFECRLKVSEETFKALNENSLFRFLQHNNVKISLSNLGALLRSDFVTTYNPFLEYFENLKTWNEATEPDYIEMVSSYVIAKEPERFKVHIKKHLVRSIACALREGYFNKHALVLVLDRQNSGKSTFCRWLCPPALADYFAENLSTDKDGSIALSENFLINLDELATMNKADINSLKSLFSKDKIKIRRPYDKRASVTPRRASFVGSTDRNEFLTDEAGSVRWLCFQLEKIDWSYQKEIDINNIWRQAYTLYKSGFKYDLTSDEIRENENANKVFRVSTAEMELITKMYSPGTKEQHDVFFTATDVLNELASKFPSVRLNQVSIGKAFTAMGYPKEQVRRGQNPIKGYYLKYLKNE